LSFILQIVVFTIIYTYSHAKRKDCAYIENRLRYTLANGQDPSLTNNGDDIYHYSKKLEGLINHQTRTELMAFYEYTNMAEYFRRFDMDMPGFHKYFSKAAMEELKHAQMFMEYLSKRGWSVRLLDITAPQPANYANGMEALKAALKLERNVTDEIMCLHAIAEKVDDPHFSDFLEGNFIPEQQAGMKELATRIKTLERMVEGTGNQGLAEFHYDKVINES